MSTQTDYEVSYTVPVTATVSDGRVVSVVVRDEFVELDTNAESDADAVEIAENSTWPEWTFGW